MSPDNHAPDTVAIVEALNQLVADTVVLYYKTRNFHWNVQGPSFFTLHAEFEALYTALVTHIDDLAERVRMLHGVPITTLANAIEQSRVEEAPGVWPAEKMTNALAADIATVVADINQAATLADNAGDRTTVDILDDVRDDLAKRGWMFESFLGKAGNA
ncbi:MAG: Dps family protein [Planctomycetota bacterium]